METSTTFSHASPVDYQKQETPNADPVSTNEPDKHASSNTAPGKPKKVLLLITAFLEGGHSTAARELAKACKKLGNYDVKMHVIFDQKMEDIPKEMRESLNDFDDHKNLNDKDLDDPKNHGLISDKAMAARKYLLEHPEEFKQVQKIIKTEKPDVIFINARWPIAAAIESRGSLGKKVPVVLSPPDPSKPHHSWTQRLGNDDYIVAAGKAAYEGLTNEPHFFPSERILTDSPVRQSFYDASKIPEETARERFELDKDRDVLLLMGGSNPKLHSGGKLAEIIKNVTEDKRFDNLQIVVAAGSSEEVKTALEESFPDRNRVRVVGNLDAEGMALLMRAATAIGTKAGGGTTLEARFMKKPLVIFQAISDLEVANALHVEEKKFGKYHASAEKFCDNLHDVLYNKTEREKISQALSRDEAPQSTEKAAAATAEFLCKLAENPHLCNSSVKEILSYQEPNQSLPEDTEYDHDQVEPPSKKQKTVPAPSR